MKWNGLTRTNLSIGQLLEVRYTIRQLVPDVVEPPVPAAPARSISSLSALKGLPFENYAITSRADKLDLTIVPVVNKKHKNTIVLQRRQSIRQAMGQSTITTTTQLTDPTLPTNGCTGDVIRLH